MFVRLGKAYLQTSYIAYIVSVTPTCRGGSRIRLSNRDDLLVSCSPEEVVSILSEYQPLVESQNTQVYFYDIEDEED